MLRNSRLITIKPAKQVPGQYFSSVANPECTLGREREREREMKRERESYGEWERDGEWLRDMEREEKGRGKE